MKLRYYFMILVGIIASIALIGCNNDKTDDGGETPPPETTGFKLTISDMSQTQFTLNVVPADKNVTYFFSYISSVDYEDLCKGTPDGLKAWIYDTFGKIALRDQIDMETVVFRMCDTGDQSETYPSEDPNTAQNIWPAQRYIAFALAVDPISGVPIGDVTIRSFRTPEAEGSYPKIDLFFRAGNASGSDTDNALTATCKIDIGDKVYIAALTTAYATELVAEGTSYSAIVSSAYGTRLAQSYIDEMKTSAGSTISFEGEASKIKSGTDYTFIIKVVSPGGRITIESATAKTTGIPPAPEPSLLSADGFIAM